MQTTQVRGARPPNSRSVAHPAGEHAGDAGDLEGRNAPAGKADIHMQMFLEHRRSPVQYGETHNINEEVAHGNDPNRRIQKNLTTQECLILGIFFGPGLRLLPSGFSPVFSSGSPTDEGVSRTSAQTIAAPSRATVAGSRKHQRQCWESSDEASNHASQFNPTA